MPCCSVVGMFLAAIFTPIAALLAAYQIVVIVLRHQAKRSLPMIERGIQEAWNG